MAVWQENLERLLKQKEVLILHGNVRDTAYIGRDGNLILGFSDLIREYARKLDYQRIVFWGIFFDHNDKGHAPLWSLERIEYPSGYKTPEIRSTGAQEREIIVLTKWLEEEIRDIKQRTIFVINYIDKLTPYSPRGIYPKDIALLITLIQKIIENIAENNRLIMVALQDSMLPLDYYTTSPKVAVTEVPIPDRDERRIYFSSHLPYERFTDEQVDFIANITDGLYLRDLENILRDVIEENKKTQELSQTDLRKIINKYRIGTEEDPWAKLPLLGPPKGIIDSAENWFKKRVIGQDHAVTEVVKAIKKARAGVVGLASGQEAKPRAVFFFAGPTGVGKTFLAKKLAEYLFDTEEAFIRIDMSEFKEEHTVSKLIGSPPGYVGYEKGGMLTNAVKNRPFSVILFDEVEKAHPRIMDIFLQILDDGRLTDSRGQTVFFTESVIIFTSNIGTRTYTTTGKPIDENKRLEEILKIKDVNECAEKVRNHFIQAVRDFFMYELSRPELLNRFGSHIIPFNYLNDLGIQRNIINTKLRDIADNFKDRFKNKGHRLSFSKQVTDYFLQNYKDSINRLGGRGIVNAIDDEIGHLLADQLLLAKKNNLTNIKFVVFINEQGGIRCKRETFFSM